MKNLIILLVTVCLAGTTVASIYTTIKIDKAITTLSSPIVEIPEEHMEISRDSTAPTQLIGYYRGDTLILGFSNNGEYQLELEIDSIHVFDNRRFVGTIPWSNSKIDSLLMNDNL